MKQLLIDGGYAFAWSESWLEGGVPGWGHGSIVLDGAFRVAFDVNLSGRSLEKVDAYVIDPLTGGPRKVGGARNQLFLWVQGAELERLGLYGQVAAYLKLYVHGRDDAVLPPHDLEHPLHHGSPSRVGR